mmetsp:Transcript_48139/g.92011  ORF Transcript_48139/g.92011 Transcript_48139/m.92011 type:complete len:244 (+) Transcript_48139:86-817(+)
MALAIKTMATSVLTRPSRVSGKASTITSHRQPRARGSMIVRASSSDAEPSVSAPTVSSPKKFVAAEHSAATAEAEMAAEPVVSSSSGSEASGQAIDPADGSVAYGAPLGDTDMVSNALSVFKGGMASEVINGRTAMVGFTAALLAELTTGESVTSQMFNMRDVGVKVIFLPKLGFFLLPLTVIVVIVSSIMPKIRGKEDNGLNVPTSAYGPFTPNAETINGRAAMMGLVSLLAVEGMTGSALF